MTKHLQDLITIHRSEGLATINPIRDMDHGPAVYSDFDDYDRLTVEFLPRDGGRRQFDEAWSMNEALDKAMAMMDDYRGDQP